MVNEGLSTLLLLVVCVVSVWLVVLFVRLCNRVKEIKAILIAAYDLEEFKEYGPFGGYSFRKRKPQAQV